MLPFQKKYIYFQFVHGLINHQPKYSYYLSGKQLFFFFFLHEMGRNQNPKKQTLWSFSSSWYYFQHLLLPQPSSSHITNCPISLFTCSRTTAGQFERVLSGVNTAKSSREIKTWECLSVIWEKLYSYNVKQTVLIKNKTRQSVLLVCVLW